MADALFDNSPNLDAINADVGEDVPKDPDEQTEKEAQDANIQAALSFSGLTPTQKVIHAGLVNDQLKDRIIGLHCENCKKAEEKLISANTDIARLRDIEIDHVRLSQVSKRRRLAQATNVFLMAMGTSLISVYANKEGAALFDLMTAQQAFGTGWALVIVCGSQQFLREVLGV